MTTDSHISLDRAREIARETYLHREWYAFRARQLSDSLLALALDCHSGGLMTDADHLRRAATLCLVAAHRLEVL